MDNLKKLTTVLFRIKKPKNAFIWIEKGLDKNKKACFFVNVELRKPLPHTTGKKACFPMKSRSLADKCAQLLARSFQE